MRDLWSEGTIHHKTRCWAQGMEGWRPVEQIAQLKWSLVASGVPLLNESEIAALILDVLIRICQFYPTRSEGRDCPPHSGGEGEFGKWYFSVYPGSVVSLKGIATHKT